MHLLLKLIQQDQKFPDSRKSCWTDRILTGKGFLIDWEVSGCVAKFLIMAKVSSSLGGFMCDLCTCTIVQFVQLYTVLKKIARENLPTGIFHVLGLFLFGASNPEVRLCNPKNHVSSLWFSCWHNLLVCVILDRSPQSDRLCANLL